MFSRITTTPEGTFPKLTGTYTQTYKHMCTNLHIHTVKRAHTQAPQHAHTYTQTYKIEIREKVDNPDTYHEFSSDISFKEELHFSSELLKQFFH